MGGTTARVNNGENTASSVISDAGTGSVASGSIGGNPFHHQCGSTALTLSYAGSGISRGRAGRGRARCRGRPARDPGAGPDCGAGGQEPQEGVAGGEPARGE